MAARSTIHLIRHAETPMNVSGGGAVERIRGRSDPDLDAHGMQELRRLAAGFMGMDAPFVISSDLKRSRATGQAISAATGGRLIVSPQFGPWDTGVLTGQPVKDAMPDVRYYMLHPEVPVPGGEPYGAWYQRYANGLRMLMQHAAQMGLRNVPVITHSRNIAATPSIITDGREPIVPGGGPPPGSITRVSLDENGQWAMEGVSDRKPNPRLYAGRAIQGSEPPQGREGSEPPAPMQGSI